ncbi:F-box/FBD/LRR-repeat protein [Hordeum vulgare]|nr:F-box/FBD/LRR-repeat protein [Hordeum vulgare]
MAAGNDRLSGLGDDLLRRVLHFVPAREGALTSALSRRWRPLWRSCGAVNLVARAHEDSSWRHHPLWRSSLALRDAFVSAAHQALDSADQAAKADGHPPIRKLTIRVEAIRSDNILRFLHGDMDYHKEHDVLGSLLAHKASRRVEELRIAAVDSVDGKPMYFERSKYEAAANIHGLGIYPLGLGSLPSGTLRVLELTNCSSLKPAAAGTSFPRLTSLRLRHCNAPFKELQRIIDAAPLLAVIHLEAILLDEDARPGFKVDTPPPVEGTLRSLRCLAATVLVLDKCCLNKNGTVEIDAPMLRHFRYKGAVRHISLDPPPQQLARAELTIIDHGGRRNSDPCRSFWGTVRGLSHAKEMKLRVRHVEEIRCHYTNEAKNIKLRRLERLELQGVYTPTENAAAQLIKNLLRCSPALSELRIELSTTAHDESTKRSYGGVQIVDRKHRAKAKSRYVVSRAADKGRWWPEARTTALTTTRFLMCPGSLATRSNACGAA